MVDFKNKFTLVLKFPEEDYVILEVPRLLFKQKILSNRRKEVFVKLRTYLDYVTSQLGIVAKLYIETKKSWCKTSVLLFLKDLDKELIKYDSKIKSFIKKDKLPKMALALDENRIEHFLLSINNKAFSDEISKENMEYSMHIIPDYFPSNTEETITFMVNIYAKKDSEVYKTFLELESLNQNEILNDYLPKIIEELDLEAFYE